jgi:L-alanine-DL-glutamate epimerase-like enolase superfamily enzyme
MKIAAIDPFYLRMPEITSAADGTQDTLLVRVRTEDGLEGWGECDASPLVSIAAYCCPMSHGNIISIRDSLLGETFDSPDDIRRLHAKVLRNGLDIQQIHHAHSGADIALWDLLGKKCSEPVYRLLGQARVYPKVAYASVLFESPPEATFRRARRLRELGFRAAKFGWGPFGRDADADEALVAAAREGLGPEVELMVDAGVAWGGDAVVACERARRLAPYRLTWLEEPFFPDAIGAYAELARQRLSVPIAGGEGCGTQRAAEDYLENSGVTFIQIDAGRIGGITAARRVCESAERRGVTYVNHTYKSRLSLAAAIHVFAGVERFGYLEYPVEGSALSRELVTGALERDRNGLVHPPEEPGLGVSVALECVRQYLVRTRIELDGAPIYQDAPMA